MTRTVNWVSAPRDPALRDDELHVRLLPAGLGPPARGVLDVLSGEEVERESVRKIHDGR